MSLEIRTIPERVVDLLRDRILSGEMSPEQPLRQDLLAAELNISKIPLREALARLERDGLLVSRPNRGFFVRPLSAAEAEEVFALRLKIEPDAAAKACRMADAGEQGAARAALEALTAAAAAHSGAVGALNRAFHLALVRPGGQEITTQLVSRLHVLADRYVRKHLEPGGRHLRAHSEHADMLEAWLARDRTAVRRLLREHLVRTLEDLREQLAADIAAEDDK